MSETAPPARPPVARGAAWLAGCAAAVGGLWLLCAGIGGATLAWGTRAQEDVLERSAVVLREEAARRADAEALLDEVGERLSAIHAVERMFPLAFPQAPPDDPWGTPLRYDRSGRDRAWVRSAGRDRKWGTSDDLVRALGEP